MARAGKLALGLAMDAREHFFFAGRELKSEWKKKKKESVSSHPNVASGTNRNYFCVCKKKKKNQPSPPEIGSETVNVKFLGDLSNPGNSFFFFGTPL